MVSLNIKLPTGYFEDEAKELVVSSKTKQIWAVELDLLKEFMRVCDKHGIRYFADAGTLLGAVRHGGFIPWDDDLDIAMFREDYDRLCALPHDEFKEPYFFQTYETDATSMRGHAQLRRSDTTGALRGEMVNGKLKYKFNQGIFIDIFPIDNLPDEDRDRAEYLDGVARRLDEISTVRTMRNGLNYRRPRMLARYMVLCIKAWLARDAVEHYVAKRHDDFVQKYNGEKTEYCYTISFCPRRNVRQYYKKEYFKKLIMLDFETLKIPAPERYDELLHGLYGDWHKHVVGGSIHGGVFFDVENSYMKYL